MWKIKKLISNYRTGLAEPRKGVGEGKVERGWLTGTKVQMNRNLLQSAAQ
jgi:hypothetical protein